MTSPARGGPDAAGGAEYVAPRWAFEADLARLNAKLDERGAIVTCSDGWRGIDESKAPPGLLRAYAGLTSYGYANGLLP